MGWQSEAGRFRYGPPCLFPGYDGGQDQSMRPEPETIVAV